MTVEPGSPGDGTEPEPPDEMGSPPASRTDRPGAGKRWARRWRLILATVVVAATVGAAAGLYFHFYRPDQQVGDAAARRAIQTASDGAVAVLSYAPDHLDRDFAKAKSYLTGNFLAYYTKFTEQIAALAQQKHVTETAQVVRAAVSELHPNSAVVLVFVNQTATSREKPQPQTTASIAVVTLTKVKGAWLISKMDPLT